MDNKDRASMDLIRNTIVERIERLSKDIESTLADCVNTPVTAAAITATLYIGTKRAMSALGLSLETLPRRMAVSGLEVEHDIADWRAYASGLCDGMTARLDDEFLYALYQCAGAPRTAGRHIFSEGVMPALQRAGWVMPEDVAKTTDSEKLPGVKGTRAPKKAT